MKNVLKAIEIQKVGDRLEVAVNSIPAFINLSTAKLVAVDRWRYSDREKKSFTMAIYLRRRPGLITQFLGGSETFVPHLSAIAGY